ncbi:MAG: dihydroxyacetone kinase transcriptional activator DhaS [Liquorilactobacillus ghanensis]|uniref:dihydroxyacetone kinase transcriptional activator DhaS n=1 Tax=Liquorilactobacillus ghanensis TaxID=399370 RepID=UPI0039E863AF
MSYILKRKIANSFQELVEKKGFDQVSITLIMKRIKIRRQTFYDYFKDKYDLLEWVINDSLEELIDNNIKYLPWKDIIKLTFFDLNANWRFYTKCIREQNEFDMTNAIAVHISFLINHLIVKNKAQPNSPKVALIYVMSLGISQLLTHNFLINHPDDYELLTDKAIKALNLTLIKLS